VGLLTASQDGTPLILLVGQSKQAFRGREAYQEVEFRKMFSAFTKHVEEVNDPSRIPEAIARAYAIAASGHPGPVVVVFPQDVLEIRAEAVQPPARQVSAPYPSPEALSELEKRLARSQRPLAIVGGGSWSEAGAKAFTAFAEAWRLPVAASFRRQALIHNDSPIYVGELGTTLDPELGARVREADLLLLVGPRISEMDTQAYSLLEVPSPKQTLVQVHPAAEELGRVYTPAQGITADVSAFAEAVSHLTPPARPVWSGWTEALRAQALNNRSQGHCPGELDMIAVMAELVRVLPEDSIICHGAGNYTGWVQRYYPFRRFGTQLAPVNGSMGYGLPAAIAAKVVHPERTVVAFAGDGCFLMNIQELATAAQENTPVLVVVINNGMYGTIRAHQEKSFPGKTLATELSNPDFTALAHAHGAWAKRVERTEDFPQALAGALGSGKLALLELIVSPEAISTRTTLGILRGEAG